MLEEASVTWQSQIWQQRLVGLKQCRLTGKIIPYIRFHVSSTESDRTEGISAGMQTLKGSVQPQCAQLAEGQLHCPSTMQPTTDCSGDSQTLQLAAGQQWHLPSEGKAPQNHTRGQLVLRIEYVNLGT